MDKTNQRALTYSLLAHVRETGQLISGPLDVFIPLVKRVLSKLNEEGIFKGKSIIEIKDRAQDIYNIEFPLPVLEKILIQISNDVNKNSNDKENFIVNHDKSFVIRDYYFAEFEETVQKKQTEINNLQKLFIGFCSTIQPPPERVLSIVEFIESSKISLAKYFSTTTINERDFSIEARFVNHFREFPGLYNQIKDLYLGAIISSYLEYIPEIIKIDSELLFDTNFILGLLDLNTPESTSTCRKLIDVALLQGYKLSILQDTINETAALLKAKANHINTTFLQRAVYPEDIYNACERRKLNKADLERMADNLIKEVSKFEIAVVYETKKYVNIARNSKEYQSLQKFRNTKYSALHDATALHYVRIKRGKKIKEFENVNCWFVNNSTKRGKLEATTGLNKDGFQPETIRADDLLNIIWLSNPQVNFQLRGNDLSGIGLSSLISLTLTESLPKSSIIRELENNIQKYANEENISDIDVVRLATRITDKQLTDIRRLNELANKNKEKFVSKIKEEANKQKEIDRRRNEKIEELIGSLEDLEGKLNKKLEKIEQESSGEKEELEEKIRLKDKELKKHKDQLLKIQKDKYIRQELMKWRRRSWIELTISLLIILTLVVYVGYESDWNWEKSTTVFKNLKQNIIVVSIIFILSTLFSGIVIRSLFQKYRNHSNIKAFKEELRIPDHITTIK